MLTPEREELLRQLRHPDGRALYVGYQDARDLLAEIDRLRAELRSQLEILEEPAPRATLDRLAERVRSGEWGCAECDRLRAENEALLEAGEGLADALRDAMPKNQYATSGNPWKRHQEALARWRETSSGAGAVQDSASAPETIAGVKKDDRLYGPVRRCVE